MNKIATQAELLAAIKAALAALTQNATFPADVNYARHVLEEVVTET